MRLRSLRLNVKHLAQRVVNPLFGHACPVCGHRAILRRHRGALGRELIAQWELSPDWAEHFDAREGTTCFHCGCSLRARHLASTLLDECSSALGIGARSFVKLVEDPRFRQLEVAEINPIGLLHRYLAGHPRLRFSSFGSRRPDVPSEDLTALSYRDAEVDLVLTSETLEHVPDIDRALRETRRVLKQGGRHVFTVPVVWDRPSRTRATLESGAVRHVLPPSYHGPPGDQSPDRLVFHELGGDFVERVREAGFSVRVARDPGNPAVSTFVALAT